MQISDKAAHHEEVKPITIIAQPTQDHGTVTISYVEYSFFAALMLMGALVIGFFIRSAFKGLTSSNTDLKKAIEKLATVAHTIHTDLISFKVEVAETYVTKTDLSQLKQDLASTCALRHNRRDTDQK